MERFPLAGQSDTVTHRGLLWPTVALTLFGLVVGILAIFGWVLEMPALRNWGAPQAETTPLTALLLILIGLAVLVLQRPMGGKWLPRLLAGAAALISVLLLVEHLTGADLGIDDLLWPDLVSGAGQTNPGRPSLQTTISLGLIAFGVLAYEDPRQPSKGVAGLCGVLSISIAVQALLGFAFGIDVFFSSEVVGAGGMSIPSAVGALTIAGALVTVATLGAVDILRDNPTSRRMIRRLLPAALIVPLISATAYGLTLTTDQIAQVFSALVGAAALGVMVAQVWASAFEVRSLARQRETLVVSLPVPALVEQDGRIVHANPAALTLFAGDESAVVGQIPDRLVSNSSSPTFEEISRRASDMGLVRAEALVRLRGGDSTLEVTAQPIDWEGEAAVLMAMLDRTEQKRYETELRAAVEEADRANQAKSEFLSAMSHELRTPLNSILGFAQLLELARLDEGQDESVQSILKAGRHLLDLINEILDLARIEAGTMEVSLEPVQVGLSVEEALGLVRPMADHAGITLEHAVPAPSDWYVLADRKRLLQVLLNVLSNAVKYNKEGGVVTVTTERDEVEKVSIRIADQGRGIPQNRLDLLFRPFERMGAGQRGVEGVGIGLALSRQLMEAMHGEIEVESIPGEGSTFMISLPTVEGAIERYERMESMSGSVEEPPHSISRVAPTILHIEDNLANLSLIEKVLEQSPLEYTLLAAMQGSIGIELARDHHPQAILLDLHLPDIHGTEVLAQLAQDPSTADIPVIVITADTSARQLERLMDSGVAGYLTKPLDVQKLLTVLAEVLG